MGGRLFVISGPSGVGKGTIREVLLQRMPDLFLSVSATTRMARAGEIEGVDYFFTSDLAFRQMIEEDKLLEHASVYSHYYGTPIEFVQKNLAEYRDVILEIDIQGAMQVKQKMPQAIFIFIYPPSIEELAKRLFLRGKDSSESIAERLAASEAEMEWMSDYDYAVENNLLDAAVEKVQAIIIAERCKIKKEVNDH